MISHNGKGARKSEGAIRVQEPRLPKGGGSVSGMGENFSSDEFTGTASIDIPLHAAPCRGFEPNLHLSYSSGSPNSPFGLGWSLSLPEISRQTSKGVPKYNDTDTFLLSGDDYLVPKLSPKGTIQEATKTIGKAEYRIREFLPRTQSLFQKIERYTNTGDPLDVYWQVTAKNNVTAIYGKSPEAKIFDPENRTQIFKWLPEEIYDAKGDRQIYIYQKEDGANIPPSLSQVNRDIAANSYLAKIKYGNQTPLAGGSLVAGEIDVDLASIVWRFEMVFDYGQYNIDPSNLDPYAIPTGVDWGCRKDPFSNYGAGFEIRTYRLCRNILMFHNFPEINSVPVLTKVTALDYGESPAMTLLNHVELLGYQYFPAKGKIGARYETLSLPPLTFNYTNFPPAEPDYSPHDYEEFYETGGNSINQGAARPPYRLTDLYGEGIPGILYDDGNSVAYRPPYAVTEKGVCYGGQKEIPFPIDRGLEGSSASLSDVTGDGRSDLMVATPERAGYYELSMEGDWKPFAPFESFPTEYFEPDHQSADLTGDGLPDIVLLEEEAIRVYPSLRGKGYGQPYLGTNVTQAPASKSDSAGQVLRFGDFIGTGLAQLAAIQNGMVECRPSLGYGKFGEPVKMENAPYFGEDFDTSRLLIADIDGSGFSDLAYLHSSHIDIYYNLSGNGFTKTPTRIPLPSSWDSLDSVQFSDVRGNGTECLVFTQSHPSPRQWFYDFNFDKASRLSQKPYLLFESDNNMGARRQITYAGSTKFYLQDKAANLPWITKLPFPVNVVESITLYDDIAGVNETSSFQYHHGFYDGIEREFRGFGRVDRSDVSAFQNFKAAQEGETAALLTPPIYTKTWYHTGAFTQDESLQLQYQKEYFSGDPHEYPLPDSTIEYEGSTNGPNPDALTMESAFRTMHGEALRSEVYGIDSSPWEGAPYHVTQSRYYIKELQKCGPNKYPVFIAHEWESLEYDYERNPLDPRINHSFTLALNDYGEVTRSAQVHYGRREDQVAPNSDSQTKSSQLKTWISCHDSAYINSPELNNDPGFYLLGIEKELKDFEIIGLAPSQGSYFNWEEIKNGVESAIGKPSANLFANVLHWSRSYYYDPAKKRELPLGSVTGEALHHRSETAVFPKSMAATLSLSPSKFQTLLTGDGSTTHGAKGGYISFAKGDQSKYYWDPGASQSYDAAQFCLPDAYYDPFQYPYVFYGAKAPPSVFTSYQYDPYRLLPIKTTDPNGNTTEVTNIDYRFILPTQTLDINGNEASAVLNPLGMVMAVSHGGTQEGGSVGFADLNNYRAIINPSLKDIIENPAKYLQGGAAYFYTDFHSWSKEKTPLYSVHINFTGYTLINGKKGSKLPPVQKSVVYSDAFGRHLQSKEFFNSKEVVRFWNETAQKVETKTETACWLTSGAVLYDNKGRPIKQYEPFFSPDYVYIDEKALNETGQSETLFYDPLGRNVLKATPEGFIAKTLFGRWGAKANPKGYVGYLNQKLYENLPNNFMPSPWSSLHFDEDDAIGDSDYQPSVSSDVDISSFDKAKKFANTPMEEAQDSLGNIAQKSQINVPPDEQSANFFTYDIFGDELTSADQRLHSINKVNFEHTYNLTKDVVKSLSADANTKWSLSDVSGNLIYSNNSRSVEEFHSYDVLHRPVQKYVKGGGALTLDQRVLNIIYGDSKSSGGEPFFQNPENLNLRSQPVIVLDEGGLTLLPSYNIHENSLLNVHVLKSDYKSEADWNSVSQGDLQALAAQIDQKYRRSDFANLTLPPPLGLLMEKESFLASEEFDAIGRVVRRIDADENIHLPEYYTTDWLKSVSLTAGPKAKSAASAPEPGIGKISYNAKGERTSLVYGNGVATNYSYDPFNFRLTRILSLKGDKTILQDLIYHHDPVGNVSSVTNNAISPVFFQGEKVGPKAEYTYDSLYRLKGATGREHKGIWANAQGNQNKFNNKYFFSPAQPITNALALQNYQQSFTYDSAGNLTQMKHSGSVATRVMTLAGDSNRINTSYYGNKRATPVVYQYDECGNMLTLEGTQGASWNYRNNMSAAVMIEREGEMNDAEYYVYNLSGRRVRKVGEQKTKNGFIIHEVIYLGGIEVRRSRAETGGKSSVTMDEWHELRLMGGGDDGKENACTWRYQVAGVAKGGAPGYQQRYQLSDKLNSSMYELDESARTISYQEYYPYGGTSIIAALNQTEVKAKHYQYGGKEQDMTGLYYYGMRYYIPWLGRWSSTDPAGVIDGLNIYAFLNGNPVSHIDVGGMGKGGGPKANKMERIGAGYIHRFNPYSVFKTKAGAAANAASFKKNSKSRKARVETFYSFLQTKLSRKVGITPQGPHTFPFHRIRSAVIFAVEHNQFQELEKEIPNPAKFAKIAEVEIPDNHSKSQQRDRAIESYKKRYQRFSDLKSNKNSFSSEDKIRYAHVINKLIQMHPLGTYAYKAGGASKSALKGKGERSNKPIKGQIDLPHKANIKQRRLANLRNNRLSKLRI